MSLLSLQNVTLDFGNAHHPILKDIHYEVNQGDFVILLGSNGSGKSSLLKCLHKHYTPTSGEICLHGKPLHIHKDKNLSREIAVLTQDCEDSLFTALTVFENYFLVHKEKNKKIAADYLADYNPNLAVKLDLTVSQLSGGEKQALALALCLLHTPTLLLLDEHTSALDPKTSEQIMELTQRMMTKHHITCILTTHDLDIALRYGNRILVLNGGRVFKQFDGGEKQKLSRDILKSSYL